MNTSQDSRLRIGILGAAHIASAFISGVAPSHTVRVTAIASRDFAKARRFANDTGVQQAYGSYEELLADPAIDAIYNPLPNSLHAVWSIRGCEAGKHVLCEKPLSLTGSEARAMFASARRHGVVLVEGFPYRAQPHALKLKELLESGAIGRVQTMQAGFGFTLTDEANIRLDPTLGGGALMDLGTYPVSLVRLVAGERPVRVQALARWHPSGVDQTLVANLQHAGGLLAQISCSFSTRAHRQALIVGASGAIQTTYPNHAPVDRAPVLQLKRGLASDAMYQDVDVPACDGFRAEAESFERLIRLGPGHWIGASSEESVDIALSLEAILKSARSGEAIDVAG
ncbi:MAG TPA: Gfo/Idh/MocA family oxidoreductase [Steroidobacteraceae bacterium]|nr:Gfo/Idh/MocA family oxidoreductase [Steroidobacteraceae bacterium]